MDGTFHDHVLVGCRQVEGLRSSGDGNDDLYICMYMYMEPRAPRQVAQTLCASIPHHVAGESVFVLVCA